MLVFHMPNSFDYFDCRLEMVLELAVAVDQLELLSCDFHLQMDCILLICSIVVQLERLVEQLDPFKCDQIQTICHYKCNESNDRQKKHR